MTRRRGPVLDLHGVRHAEVEGEVVRFLNDNWSTTSDLLIVTGMSKRMQDLVRSILDQHSLEHVLGEHWSPSRGTIRVLM